MAHVVTVHVSAATMGAAVDAVAAHAGLDGYIGGRVWQRGDTWRGQGYLVDSDPQSALPDGYTHNIVPQSWVEAMAGSVLTPGLPIPPPPADIARELKAERIKAALRRQLATCRSDQSDHSELPEDPEEHIDQMAARNPWM